MKKLNPNYLAILLIGCQFIYGQKVAFEEYDLENGLHVILHQDNSVPIVTTSVLYHVGSKDENPERTGFAHFFEHLLFEGTKTFQRESGSVSSPVMGVPTTPIPPMILPTTMKIFLQIISSWAFGWNPNACSILS